MALMRLNWSLHHTHPGAHLSSGSALSALLLGYLSSGLPLALSPRRTLPPCCCLHLALSPFAPVQALRLDLGLAAFGTADGH